MHRSDQRMCVTFFVAGLISIWGVLYDFWHSFEAFPVASRVWDMDLDKVCALPNASLSVVPMGESVFICLRSVDGINGMALVGNSSSFIECTLLDTLVYLHGGKGGLCLAFLSKAQADAFVASIGFKDLTQRGDTEDGDTEDDDTPEDDTPEDDDTESSGRGSPTLGDSSPL